MSVICDTTKIKAYIDKSMGTWNVLIRRLKNRNGKSVKFSISRDLSLTEEEVCTMFFERLERGEFKQKSTTGGGVLRQHDDGSYYLEYPKAALGASEKKVSESPVKQVTPIVGNKNPVLFDTHDPAVRALVGKPVTGSTTYVFAEGTTFNGTLESVSGTFHVRTTYGMMECPFIRERKPEPLDLSNPAVRRSLLGKIIICKDNTCEIMLNVATKKDGTWRMNGLSTYLLMNDYTFEDGTPLTAAT